MMHKRRELAYTGVCGVHYMDLYAGYGQIQNSRIKGVEEAAVFNWCHVDLDD